MMDPPSQVQEYSRPPVSVPFDELKNRRRADKMVEFRRYLADSGTVEALVKLMVGLKESAPLNDENPRILKNYFGDFRDPKWDEIDALRASIADLREKNDKLELVNQTTVDSIAKEELRIQLRRIWRGLSNGQPTFTLKEFLTRCADKKHPRIDANPHAFSQADFQIALTKFTDPDTRCAIISLAYPEGGYGTPSDLDGCFKGKNDDPLLDSLISALEQFEPEEAM